MLRPRQGKEPKKKKREKEMEQKGKWAHANPCNEDARTHARTKSDALVSTVPREDQRSQSTFIAVAGLDCVEKLTEQ